MKRLQKMILPGAVLLVCLLALIGWKAYSNRVGKTQTIATVIQNGEVVYTFDLANVTETQEFTLGEPGKQNVIQVSPQGIGVGEITSVDAAIAELGTVTRVQEVR